MDAHKRRFAPLLAPFNANVRPQGYGRHAMKPEIASLHERTEKGGDWRVFRDEIAALHAEATNEEEYITLLEAHRKLVAVGKFAFDEETYAKLLPVAAA